MFQYATDMLCIIIIVLHCVLQVLKWPRWPETAQRSGTVLKHTTSIGPMNYYCIALCSSDSEVAALARDCPEVRDCFKTHDKYRAEALMRRSYTSLCKYVPFFFLLFPCSISLLFPCSSSLLFPCSIFLFLPSLSSVVCSSFL